MSVLDIWNDAASQISNETIGSLEEDSPIAQACRDQWPAIRDHLLSLADWKFAERRQVLTGSVTHLEPVTAGHQETRIISLPLALQDARYRYRIVFRFQNGQGGQEIRFIPAPVVENEYVPAGASLTAPITYADINVPVTLESPTEVAAITMHERILLTWFESPEATDYNYRWREEGRLDWTTVVGTDRLPQAVVLGLENGRTYEFQVMAKNPYGISRWTDVSKGIPEEPSEELGQPPPTPTGLEADGGRREVTLTWNPVSTATGYDYRYRFQGAWIEVTDQEILGSSYIVSPLVNDQEYEFQIRARNERGFSDWTASATATPTGNTPLVPTGLEAAPGNTTMLLSWNRVPEADDYDVRYRLTTMNDWTEITDTTIADTSVIVTGLTNGSPYQFSVRARITTNISTEQDSDWSGHIVATPSSSATPRIPTVQAEALNASVRLTWTAISGAVDYDVRWRRTDVATDWNYEADETNDPATAHTVLSLVNGRTYEFQVRAQRAADLGGPGPWSDSVTATPMINPVAPVNSPVLTTSSSGSSRSVLLTWTFVGNDASGWEYRWREGDSGSWSSWITTAGEVTRRSQRHYPSKWETRYCYQVRATNAAGAGPESNIACANTPAEPAPLMPPGAVTLSSVQVTATSATEHRVTLRWSGGSGADSFEYSWNGTNFYFAGNGNTSSRTFVTTELTGGQEYCWEILASNDDGATYSDAVCETAPTYSAPPPVELNPPGAVSLTVTALNVVGGGVPVYPAQYDVTIAWSGGSGATSFEYREFENYIGFGNETAWTYAGGASANSLTFRSVYTYYADTRVCWQIRARNDDGVTQGNDACFGTA